MSLAVRDDRERRIQLALSKLNAGQHASIGAAAAAHGVAKTTLYDRSKGKVPKSEAQIAQQSLSPSAEMALADHIRRSAVNRFPLNPADVVELARKLACGSTGNSGTENIGHSWLTGFLVRHEEVKSCWSRCLENARTRSTNAETIRQWFNRLVDVIQEYHITDDNMYNMDETGFIFGQGGSQRVLVPDDINKHARFKSQPGNRDSASVIECIGGGGTVLPPHVITKGQTHQYGDHRRAENVPATWCFSKQTRGYTDSQLTKLWLERIFDVNTKPSSPSTWRLLLMDGFSAHVNSVFLHELWNRRIVPLCFPAHSTHVMQPLDVSIFGPLTSAYCRLVTAAAPHVPESGIDRALFTDLYAQAREQTITSSAARKAFNDSGMTSKPCPQKVLNRVTGSTDAGRQSPTSGPAASHAELVPRSLATYNSMLDAHDHATNRADKRDIKKKLLEHESAHIAEDKRKDAEIMLVRDQLAHATAMKKKVRKKILPGDQVVLSLERMITRAEAEDQLIAKRPQVEKAKQRSERQKEKSRAVDNKEAIDDDDEELSSPSATGGTPSQMYLDMFDAASPLSAIDNDEPAESDFYEDVPSASTSRRQL